MASFQSGRDVTRPSSCFTVVVSLAAVFVPLGIALVVRRSLGRGEGSGVPRAGRTIRLDGTEWVELFSPALCGFIAFCAFVAALRLGGFQDTRLGGSDLSFLTLKAASLPDPAYVGAEVAARAVWSLSLAAVVLAALTAVWAVAGILLESDRGVLWRAIPLLLILVGVAPLVYVASTGKMALGAPIAQEMLSRTWDRTRLSHIGALTDGLNIAGALLIPVLVSLAFCILLEPVRLEDGTDSPTLHNLGYRWKQLHVLLYASAAVLTAGVIEIVALYAWSLAPFSGVSELKAHADICKTSGSLQEAISNTGFCRDLPRALEHAEAVDSLRRLVRAHAITFGAGFSALLAALYAPAALLFRSRFQRLITPGSSADNGGDNAAVLRRYGLEMDLPKRLLNLIVTLGPLVIGILSAIITF